MGLEYTLQSIPQDCCLLDAARKHPEIGVFLELFGFADVSFEDLKFRAADEAFATYLLEVKSIAERNDGIADRRLNLGRRWDVMLYLLSGERRNGGSVNDRSWQYRAINGGDIIDQSVVTTRGVPVRYLTSAETREIAGRLREVDREQTLRQFDLVSMAATSVYGSNTVAGLTEDQAASDLGGLMALYTAAAENDEAILTFCT